VLNKLKNRVVEKQVNSSIPSHFIFEVNKKYYCAPYESLMVYHIKG